MFKRSFSYNVAIIYKSVESIHKNLSLSKFRKTLKNLLLANTSCFYSNQLSLVRKKFLCYEEDQKLVENFNAAREILQLISILHRKRNSEKTDSDSKYCSLVDDELRFRQHVSTLIQRAYTPLRILYRNQHVLDRRQKNKLYETLILYVF
nr:unnamed protein product [Callosobruchus analis]